MFDSIANRKKDSQALVFIIVRALVIVADAKLGNPYNKQYTNLFITMNCTYSNNSFLCTQGMWFNLGGQKVPNLYPNRFFDLNHGGMAIEFKERP